MSNSHTLRSDPYILPSLSPRPWEDIADCRMAENRDSDNEVQMALRRVFAEQWIEFFISFGRSHTGILDASLYHFTMLQEPTGLLPIDDDKASKYSLSYCINGRPILSETKGRKEKQDSQESHHSRVIHD